MRTMTNFSVGFLWACMMTAAMGFADLAVAAPPVPIEAPPLIDFPAGIACDFPLRLEQEGSNFHLKEFFDKNGNPVRVLVAGKGSFMTFTNLESGATLSLKNYGFAAHLTDNGDGTITETDTGHVALILFPTDIPAGPSTTSYVGRLIYTVDLNTGVFTVQSFTGKAIDVCAALD